MQVFNTHTIPAESVMIAELVKNNLSLADTTASLIFFGSRSRGDASPDSDWDFLILTQEKETGNLEDNLRKIMREKVELPYNVAISLLVKNTILWESDYAVTNIYESIREEGILL